MSNSKLKCLLLLIFILKFYAKYGIIYVKNNFKEISYGKM